jgi:multidrug efflux pump subunit AcrB
VIPVGDEVQARVTAVIASVPDVTLRDPTDHIVGFTSPDPDELQREADKLAAALATNKRLHVVQTIGGTSLVPNIKVDRDMAARLGLTANDIDMTLYATSGVTATTLFTHEDALPVMVSLGDNDHWVDALAQIYVRSTSGAMVPLSAFITTDQQSQPAEVFHEGQFPWLGIRVNGPLDELQAVLAKSPVPQQIRRDVREVDEASRETSD